MISDEKRLAHFSIYWLIRLLCPQEQLQECRVSHMHCREGKQHVGFSVYRACGFRSVSSCYTFNCEHFPHPEKYVKDLCYVNINVLQRIIILTDILQPTQGKSIPAILYAASKEDNFKGFENKYNIPGEQVNAAPQQFSY